MAKLNANVNAEELKADIEAVKNAKSEEEVNQIKAKYADAVAEMNEAKAAPAEEKKAPAKKATAKKPAAKKETTEKKPAAKKATTKKAEEKPVEEKKTPAKKVTKKEAAPAEEKKPAAAKKPVTKKDEAPAEKKGRQYNGKYEVYQDTDGYCYRLKASNGEILVVSETYTSKDGVMKAIDSVKRNVETGKVTVYADKRGQYQFKLTSGNNRTLLYSANYTAKAVAERASESFKKFALKADIVEVELDAKEANLSTPIEIVKEEKTGGKFVVEKFNDEFSWDLKASNGQILCQSQPYKSKKGCMDAIDTFKKNVETGTFKCIKDKNDRYFFKLYDTTGRVVAIGESYASKDSAENAANSVAGFINTAEITEEKNED